MRGTSAIALAVLAGALTLASPASASDVQRIEFRYGPVAITPGQNTIVVTPNTEKPRVDGWITRIEPNLKRRDGTVPAVDVVHLHHGVWLTSARTDTTWQGWERFFAAGEEKTVMNLPPGYGLEYKARDAWLMNHMIHNLTTSADEVYITYTIDFVPANTATAKTIRPVRPIWMDVQNGSAYPVYDVYRGTGGDGKFTYPDEARNPYGSGPRKNEWTVDRDGTLVSAAGHLHPGGLWTELELLRPGGGQATTSSVRAPDHGVLHRRLSRSHRRGHRRLPRRRGRARVRAHRRLHRRIRRAHTRGHRAPPTTSTTSQALDRVLIQRSRAIYWDPNGPVSWDMAMTESTGPSWMVRVRKGDKLRLSATYETERASWYEAMGIEVVYMADGDTSGKDPFKDPPADVEGEVTHGHLAENENYGGEPTGLPDASKLPDGPNWREVGIAAFQYLPGDLNASAEGMRNPPVVRPGQRLRFENLDSHQQVYHSITSCKPPCTGRTGISYPLADGPIEFDSGQLGYGPTGFTAAANRTSWETPPDLQEGTYTYFCRVHPFMRGAFRVNR